MTITKHRVWKFGDNINTDVIFPGKYTYTISHDPNELAKHALEDLDPNFSKNAQQGDVIVAGRFWGNGSSREQAVTCLVALGIKAVIAHSFARIYFRNAINNGLLVIECPEIVPHLNSNDTLELDLENNVLICDSGKFAWGNAGVGGMILNGSESNDSLVGAELGDLIDGLAGNDSIDAFAGDDRLIGGNGNDSLDGGEGNDGLECGSGLDIAEGFDGLDLLYGGGGDDRLYGGAGNDVLYGEAQVDELYGETDDDRLFGGDDGDTLDGDVGNDTLWGEAGDDTLLGRAGLDILIGGPGADMLEGGDDDDVYIWQLGDGDDIIDGDNTGNEVLWIGGYGPADLTPLRAGSDYVLVTPTGSIRVLDYYSGQNQIESIQTELP
jgi:3-isopropylmalate/(R)-2-methylmalate dehydratase small subunit